MWKGVTSTVDLSSSWAVNSRNFEHFMEHERSQTHDDDDNDEEEDKKKL